MNQQTLFSKFPAIVVWHRAMGSYSYYIESVCNQALITGAPRDALYLNSNNRWVTVHDLAPGHHLLPALCSVLNIPEPFFTVNKIERVAQELPEVGDPILRMCNSIKRRKADIAAAQQALEIARAELLVECLQLWTHEELKAADAVVKQ